MLEDILKDNPSLDGVIEYFVASLDKESNLPWCALRHALLESGRCSSYSDPTIQAIIQAQKIFEGRS